MGASWHSRATGLQAVQAACRYDFQRQLASSNMDPYCAAKSLFSIKPYCFKRHFLSVSNCLHLVHPDVLGSSVNKRAERQGEHTYAYMSSICTSLEGQVRPLRGALLLMWLAVGNSRKHRGYLSAMGSQANRTLQGSASPLPPGV